MTDELPADLDHRPQGSSAPFRRTSSEPTCRGDGRHRERRGLGLDDPDENAVRRQSRTLAVWISVIVYLGLVTNRSVSEQLWLGRHPDLAESFAGPWQYVREGLTVLLIIWLAWGWLVRRRSSRLPITVPVAVALALLLFIFQAARVAIDPELPLRNIAIGARVFYIAAIAILVGALPQRVKVEAIRFLTLLLIPMAVAELALAIRQILFAPGVLGTTFLGSRPWGSYSSANSLGMSAIGMLLVSALQRSRSSTVLGLICIAICLLSGSRNAILGAALVLGGLLVAQYRARLLLIPAGVALFFIALDAASSQAISGRSISGEGRFTAWSSAVDLTAGPFEFLFGRGLGIGTNGAVVLSGRSAAEGTAISDSSLTMMFVGLGVVGLAAYICALGYAAARMRYDLRSVVIPCLALSALTFNLPEISPLNLLAAVVLGAGCASDNPSADQSRGRRTVQGFPAATTRSGIL